MRREFRQKQRGLSELSQGVTSTAQRKIITLGETVTFDLALLEHRLGAARI